MSTSIPLTAAFALAALAVALATAVGPPYERETQPFEVLQANGDVVISNSKEGLPILSMSNMKPGDTATGTVELQNTGSARGYIYLAPLDIVSPPGPGGGTLAENLMVRVSLTKGGVTDRKHNGILSKMGTVTAGRFRPGETGTYTFELIARDTGLPPPPTLSRPVRGDNKYQGTSASVTFGWSTSPG